MASGSRYRLGGLGVAILALAAGAAGGATFLSGGRPTAAAGRPAARSQPAAAVRPTAEVRTVAATGGIAESAELPGVEYGTDGGPLDMDVYLPGTARGGVQVPVVLLLHGGGWAGGSRTDVAPEAQALVDAGLAVLNVDYRLSAPGLPGYPHQIADARMALAWAASHATALGLDMRRVGALGVSAGGNLALELGVRGVVSSVVAWSAPTDLAAFETQGSRCTTAACGPLSLPYAVYRYLGCLPEACPARYVTASPASQRSAPGTRYMVWNSSDELVPAVQEDEFVAEQRGAGVPVTERRLAGHLHAAQYAGTALAPSVDFLASSLAETPAS